MPTQDFSEKYLANYRPEPVSVEDIVDGDIRTHGTDWYEEKNERASETADSLAESLLLTIASPQKMLGLNLIDPKLEINKAKLRSYILGRIEVYLAPEELEETDIELRKRIYRATVDHVYQQYGSIRILINDPSYQGSPTVFIDDLKSVIQVLDAEPKKGHPIKVTNMRREQTTKTKSPKGTRTWQNQIIADICPDQS